MRRFGARTRIFVIGVTVLGALSISGAQEVEPPYHGTVFIDPDIITEADPTTFRGLSKGRREQRFVFDRRTDELARAGVYVFEARYDDGLHIEAQVNAEFGDVAAAREAAEQYGRLVGQLPTALRVGVETLTIHRGDGRLGGGNNDILIHTDHAERLMQMGVLAEGLMHEGAHSSLDADHKAAPGWLRAQRADGNFISTYARDHPMREDVAESFNTWFAIRHRSDRVTEGMIETIERTIPNRLAYFDSLGLDMYPTASPPVHGEGRHGLGTTLSYVVAGTTDVLAEIEYVDYAMHGGRWVAVVFNDAPLPADDACHGMTHEYRDLQTGNWVACLRDGELLGELAPHAGFFRFPLAAGDTWSQVMSWTDHVHPGNSSAAPFSHAYEVEACGVDVRVPAGEFTTCRVRFVQAGETRWYDPELDLVVKTEAGGVAYELWDYDLAAPLDTRPTRVQPRFQPRHGEGRHGLGTTLSYAVAGTTALLAEIEYVDYALHNGRWVLVVFNDQGVQEGHACHGRTHVYRDLRTGNWVACLRDGEVLAELTPHNGFLRFPLAAGENWSQWASWKDHVYPENSTLSPFIYTYEVEACGGVVDAPAGRFTTCRVGSVETGETLWYDPELDLVVKWEVYGVAYELWDYDLMEPEDDVEENNT